MKLRRVVVTGLGALTPVGNNVSEYWKNLSSGVSGAAPITHFDPEKFRTKFACEVKNFDPLDFLERKESRKMDNYTRYAIVSSSEAIRSSGIDLEKADRDRIGVIWGSGIGGLLTFEEEVSGFATGDGTPRFMRPSARRTARWPRGRRTSRPSWRPAAARSTARTGKA